MNKGSIIRNIIACVLIVSLAPVSYGVTCTPGDDTADVCKLEVIEGTRCVSVEFFKDYCNNNTDGCDGTCTGFVPPGHWYPLVDDSKKPRWRCRCGCFADMMRFDAADGEITAAEIIKMKGSNILLASLDSFEKPYLFTYREIKDVMHSKEANAYYITTQSGRTLVLSAAHPVVLGDSEGHLVEMKKAKDLKEGERLIAVDGWSDQIVGISLNQYGREMMNFNISTDDPSNRIVSTNGILTGDLGWQETLHRNGSRQWFRHDILKAIKQYKTGRR